MQKKKICLLGSYGVGKTSLVARFVHSMFADKYHTTVGVKIDKKVLTVDGEEQDVPAGTAVFVRDPESKRAAVATADGTTVISLGGKPGEAYAPRAWEINMDVFAMFERGEIAEAKSMILDARKRFDDAALTYNLACAEARLGETDQAVEHLAAALEQRPNLVELAREDTDLDAIRADPRFDELLAARSG